MNAKSTPIDPVTDLIRYEDGRYAITWAGCLYGPADTLEEIANSTLLEEAKEAAQRPENRWRLGKLHDPDDGLGPRFIYPQRSQCCNAPITSEGAGKFMCIMCCQTCELKE